MATVTLQPQTERAARSSFTALAALLKALGDPTRLAMVALLARREHCVCDLMAALTLPQSTCSHHLGVLKRAGLVRDRRDADDARWAYYSLTPAAIAALREQLVDLLDLRAFDPAPARCE
ncbi:MAG: metalloregulator ArsR/SmtB family transcription factor [Chloroflexota bacterium]|nr:metalloregulator ArsR/SmtB family transcription factor [Chloroflexota bacterium]